MSRPTDPTEQTLEEGEREAVAFHIRTAGDSMDMWRQGLNRLLRATDDLTGRKIGEEVEAVLIALFFRAWNTLNCARDLAERGYYSQSLNLLRSPVEDWLAYWYLRSFPERHDLFLDLASKTPTFNDMLTQIEGKQGAPPDALIRGWIKRLHSYSHVDRKGIRMILRHEDGALHFGLGPDTDEAKFQYCASEALGIVGAFLETLNNFRLLLEISPIPGLENAYAEIQHWQDDMRARYGDALDAEDLPSE